MTDAEKRRVLLGSSISRCNKMHLASGWDIAWRWEGDGPDPSGTMRSRMLFWFDGQWRLAKSWDEDVRPLLKDRNPEKTTG